MFGAIELSYGFNDNLMEKAGREGFITNAAYRQLRDIMEDLFKQFAKTFFRKEADRSGEYNRIKEELQHRAKLLQKREKRVKVRKVFFESSLETFFERVQSGKPDELAEEIISITTQRLDAIEKLNDAENATHELLKLESFAKEKIDNLRSQYTVKNARGFSTSKKVSASWHAYQDEMEKMEKTLFRPLSAWIDKAITKVARKETIALDRRRRARKAIGDTQRKSIRTTKSTGLEALKKAKELVETVRRDASSRISHVSETINRALAEFAKIDTTNLTESQIKKTTRNTSAPDYEDGRQRNG